MSPMSKCTYLYRHELLAYKIFNNYMDFYASINCKYKSKLALS